MAKHRTYSFGFKRQVAQEFLAGETLHGLLKRHDVYRNLIRVWFRSTKLALSRTKLRPPTCSSNTRRIAALERLVGKQVPGAFHFFVVQRKQPQSVKKDLPLSRRERPNTIG